MSKQLRPRDDIRLDPMALEMWQLGQMSGRLKVWQADGTLTSTLVQGRHFRLLHVMNRALQEDEVLGLDEPDRGWRTAEQLAALYADEPVPPETQTIHQYLSQITRALRLDAPPGIDAPRLFVSKRLRGVRLVCKIAVTDKRRL